MVTQISFHLLSASPVTESDAFCITKKKTHMCITTTSQEQQLQLQQQQQQQQRQPQQQQQQRQQQQEHGSVSD